MFLPKRHLSSLLVPLLAAGCLAAPAEKDTAVQVSSALASVESSLLVAVTGSGYGPVEFLGRVTVDLEDGVPRTMAMTLIGLRGADRTPSSVALTVRDIAVDAAGHFTADFGQVQLPAEVVGVPSAVTLDLRLDGSIHSRCGEAFGRVLAPVTSSIDHGTWGAVVVTPGAPLPLPVTRCAMPAPAAPAAYLLSIPIQGMVKPLRFLADADVEGGALALRLQPLRALDDAPTGAVLASTAPVSATGDFDADFGEVLVPSDIFEFPSGDMRLRLHLAGNAMRRCGETTVTLVAPSLGTFQSTWAAVPITGPSLPPALTRCSP